MNRTGGPEPTSWTRTSTPIRSRWIRRSVGCAPIECHSRRSAAPLTVDGQTWTQIRDAALSLGFSAEAFARLLQD